MAEQAEQFKDQYDEDQQHDEGDEGDGSLYMRKTKGVKINMKKMMKMMLKAT